MEWYQLSYCIAGADFYHVDGGRNQPRKFWTYSTAQEREKELLQRYPGASTLIVKVEEVAVSSLATREQFTMTQYTGIFEMDGIPYTEKYKSLY